MKTIHDYLEEFFIPKNYHLLTLEGKVPKKRDWPNNPLSPQGARKTASHGNNIGWCPKDAHLIIDIDPRSRGDVSFTKLCELAQLDEETLYQTYPTIVTGSGGYHIYTARPPDFKPSKTSKSFPGIDLIHHNAQVLIPGCTHPETGAIYHPRPDTPWPIDPPTFPAALLETIQTHWGSFGDFYDLDAPREELRGVLDSRHVLELLSHFDPADFRSHDDWVSFILGLHHASDADLEVFDALLEWSLKDPEYQDDPRVEPRLKQIWESGRSNHHKPRTIWWYLNKVPKDACEVVRVDAEYKEVEVLVNEAQNFENGIDEDHTVLMRLARLSPEVRKEALNELAKFGVVGNKHQVNSKSFKLAKATAKKHKTATETAEVFYEKYFKGRLLYISDRDIFYFKKTQWERITHSHITQFMMKTAPDMPFNKLKNVCAGIKSLARLSPSLDAFEPPQGFNLQNCTLLMDPHTAQLSTKSHDPEDTFFYTLPYDYDPLATCPAFDMMLTQTFQHLPPPQLPHFIEYFWELFGYLIQPRKDIPLLLIWEGNGHNGKTTYSRFLSYLTGNAFAGGDLRKIHRSEHGSASLEGKLVFVDDDVAAGTILDDSFLKTHSESKEVVINPKFQVPRKVIINATPVLLMNNSVMVLDMSEGLRRRTHVIPFHTNVGHLSQDLPNQARNELPGIFNNALIGLIRLRQRGRFDPPPIIQETTQDFFTRSNPAMLFMDITFEPGASSFPVDNVFAGYRMWSRGAGYYATLDQTRFVDILRQTGYIIENREIQNITLKPNAELVL